MVPRFTAQGSLYKTNFTRSTSLDEFPFQLIADTIFNYCNVNFLLQCEVCLEKQEV